MKAKAQCGFTLIEVMIAIAIVGILAAIALPSYKQYVIRGNRPAAQAEMMEIANREQQYLLSNRSYTASERAYANNLVASAITTRSEAIKRNAMVTMCASTDGANCATAGGWEQGWIVMCNTVDHTKCDLAGSNAMVLQRQQGLPSGVKVTGLDVSSSAIRVLTFQPTGVDATQASLTVCRAAPSAGRQERVVTISATGRASITKTAAAICS